MGYKYKPDDYSPQVGDVVQWPGIKSPFLDGDQPYLVEELTDYGVKIINTRGKLTSFGTCTCKTIKTKSATEASVGDTVMCTTKDPRHGTQGNLYIAEKVNKKSQGTHQQFLCDGTWYYCRDFLILQQEEPELLHQKWKDLHDSGVQLEAQNAPDGVWYDVDPNRASNTWESSRFTYRHKVPEMKITDHVINIKDTPLADRLKLRQVLLDNGQKIFGEYRSVLIKCNPASECYEYKYGSWRSLRTGTPTITLQDFIDKYKKSDEIRNLAFTSRSTDWTDSEAQTIADYVYGYSGADYALHQERFKYDDGTDAFQGAWPLPDKSNRFKCVEVAFEDVFPEVVEEPAEPKFEYPIYKQRVNSALVIRFEDEYYGTCIVGDSRMWDAGDIDSVPNAHHDVGHWQDWDPQFDYDTIMQPDTVVHCTTESEANELCYWADQQGLTNYYDEAYMEWGNYYVHKEHTYYDLNSGRFGNVNTSGKDYIILTMDEARNGKQPKPQTKESTMGKPLLSDLLKEHGVYEKFLTNLSVKIHNYKSWTQYSKWYSILEYVLDECHDEAVFNAYDSWYECANDVRAPDDVEYWQSQHEAGKDIWVYDPTDGWIGSLIGVSPKIWVGVKNATFYVEEPTWLGKTWELYNGDAEASDNSASVSTEEQTMSTTITYTDEEIKVAMRGKKCKVAKVAKPKTDLQLAKKVTLEVEYFNSDGASEGCVKFTSKYAKALKKAASRLTDADTRGWAMLNKNTGKITTEKINLVTK